MFRKLKWYWKRQREFWWYQSVAEHDLWTDDIEASFQKWRDAKFK